MNTRQLGGSVFVVQRCEVTLCRNKPLPWQRNLLAAVIGVVCSCSPRSLRIHYLCCSGCYVYDSYCILYPLKSVARTMMCSSAQESCGNKRAASPANMGHLRTAAGRSQVHEPSCQIHSRRAISASPCACAHSIGINFSTYIYIYIYGTPPPSPVPRFSSCRSGPRGGAFRKH